ncbi:MAG: hypothetical protein RIQ94_1954 [Pseudomonadota bacterium]
MVKILDLLALLAYCALIYWLSDQSSVKNPFDYHAGAYFIMGILIWRVLHYQIASSIVLMLLSISFCALYGLSDEWHQSFIHGRESDSADWLADTIGSTIAILLAYISGKSINKSCKT